MNTLIELLGGHAKNWARKFWKLSITARVVTLLILIAISVLVLRLGAKEELLVVTDKVGRSVSISRVSDLSLNIIPLPLFGTITSRNEATIRAESGGKIVTMYKKLGDYVNAGTVIAEFENSAERALVLQAEGAYEGASAGKDIAGINKDSSGNALYEAKTQALNVIASTYTVLDDAVRTKTDTAWRNPQTRDAKLIVTVADAKLVIQLESERTAIETMLLARDTKNRTLNTESNLVAELDLIEVETNLVKDYLDDLSFAWNRALADGNASQATIDGYKASTGMARTGVNGTLSLIANTRNALNASLSANKIAEKNSSVSGIDSGSFSDAQVKSALGNLRGAQARLEKTIVRSPIGGTINSLSINTGDFVSPYTEVAVVSNNGALEVVVHVTEDDARELVVGGNVTINSTGRGAITRIAPALDPSTKKIEVRIGIIGGAGSLVNGESVRVDATRTTNKAAGPEIKIPLSALKITPNGAIIFTVSASSTLVAHAVTMGSLLGDQIVVPAGLTLDMAIVTDARGLQDGMIVIVK